MICINTEPLENVSIYHKRKLQYYLKEACVYLNIEQPKLEFIDDYTNSHYPYWKKTITIGSKNMLKRRQNYIEPYINFEFKNYFSALIFTLFHELGHHIQFIKYPRSTQKHWDDIKKKWGTLNRKTYRDHLFESRADKIAIFLTKKYTKEYYV